MQLLEPSSKRESQCHHEDAEYQGVGSDPEGDHQRACEGRDDYQNPKHHGGNTAQCKQPLAGNVLSQSHPGYELEYAAHDGPYSDYIDQIERCTPRPQNSDAARRNPGAPL